MNNYKNILTKLKEDLEKLNVKLTTTTNNLNQNEKEEEELELEIDDKKILLKNTKIEMKYLKNKLNKDLNTSITLKTIGTFVVLGAAIVLSAYSFPELINTIIPSTVLEETKILISSLLTLLGGGASCYIAATFLGKSELQHKKEAQDQLINSKHYQDLLKKEKELSEALILLHTRYEDNIEKNEILSEEYYDCKSEISKLKGAINYIESKQVPKANTLTKIKKLIPNHTK